MKKYFKLLIIAVAMLFVVVALCACKSKKSEASNPMVETDYKGMVEATGIDLPAPDGAKDAEYRYYKTDPKMAEVEFELGDVEYTLRAQPTSLTSVAIAEEDIAKIDADLLRSKYGDISGIYCEWKSFATVLVSEREGYYAAGGEYSIVNWLDAVTGTMYSLSTDEKDVTQQTIMDVATKSFKPMQGEV